MNTSVYINVSKLASFDVASLPRLNMSKRGKGRQELPRHGW